MIFPGRSMSRLTANSPVQQSFYANEPFAPNVLKGGEVPNSKAARAASGHTPSPPCYSPTRIDQATIPGMDLFGFEPPNTGN